MTSFIIECEPGLGAANGRYADRSSKRLSDAYKAYRKHVWAAWHEEGRPVFEKCCVQVLVRTYWGKVRFLLAEGEKKSEDTEVVAGADVDALGKSTLDALELAGAFGHPPVPKKYRQRGTYYGDDVCVIRLDERKYITSRDRGWVEIEIHKRNAPEVVP